MSTDRVLIGKYDNGVDFGLRIALTGISAQYGNSAAADQFSFDSNWTDLVQLHQVGLATTPASTFQTVLFPNLGYKPFVEVRYLSGTTISDDSFSASRIGVSATISADRIVAPGIIGGSYSFLYIVYKVSVPTQ